MPPILVVEDDKEMQRLVRSMLELEGFTVEVAGDGRSARAWLSEHRPSLMLLDWMLPDMSGAAVAEQMKAIYGDAVRIVLLTAADGVLEKAGEIGAYACIAKPFSIDDMIATVRRALESD